MGAYLTDNMQFVEFYIQDSGSGIPDEIQDKIFDKFFTTKSAGQGTGLGLPIIKQIIEQHKGYIRLKTIAGTATTFYIGLPTPKSNDCSDCY